MLRQAVLAQTNSAYSFNDDEPLQRTVQRSSFSNFNSFEAYTSAEDKPRTSTFTNSPLYKYAFNREAPSSSTFIYSPVPLSSTAEEPSHCKSIDRAFPSNTAFIAPFISQLKFSKSKPLIVNRPAPSAFTPSMSGMVMTNSDNPLFLPCFGSDTEVTCNVSPSIDKA